MRFLIASGDPDLAAFIRTSIGESPWPAEAQFEHLDDLRRQIATLQANQTDLALVHVTVESLDDVRMLRQTRITLPIVAVYEFHLSATHLALLEQIADECLPADQLSTVQLQRAIKTAARHRRLSNQLDLADRLLHDTNQRFGEHLDAVHRFIERLGDQVQQCLPPIAHLVEQAPTDSKEDGTQGAAGSASEMTFQTQQLINWVDDIRDISRVDRGRLTICRESFEVQHMLDSLQPSLHWLATHQGIQLTVDVQPGLPTIYGDELQIRRALHHLIEDTVEFAPQQSTVELCVRCQPGSQQIVFEIRDHGPRISADDLDEITRQTESSQITLQSALKGNSIRQIVARQMIGFNLGAIEIDSHPEEGNRLRILLPTSDSATQIDEYLSRVDALRLGCRISLFTTHIDNEVSPATTKTIHRLLQNALTVNDLVYQIDNRSWAIVTCSPPKQLNQFPQQIKQQWLKAARSNEPPLPAVRFEMIDTWALASHRAQIIETFDSLVCPDIDVDWQPRCVLVIDENSSATTTLENGLQAAGYDVITAADNQQVLQSARSNHPDAIILDASSLEADGWQTLAQLQQCSDTKDTPIIMLAESARQQQRAMEQGARFCLLKPRDSQTLISALTSSLSNPPQATIPTPAAHAVETAST